MCNGGLSGPKRRLKITELDSLDRRFKKGSEWEQSGIMGKDETATET